MANLRANNLTGTGGRNAMKGSVSFSGYVDGTSADWLQIHDNLGDFNVGTGDFTFECWVKAAKSANGYAGIFGMYNYDTAGILIQIHDNGRIRLCNPGTIDQTGTDANAIIWGPNNGMGDWHHYAVARSGSTLKAFLNGVEQISTSYSNAIDFSNGGSAVIGITDRNDYPGDYDLNGYISNLRLIKGTALYTSNFIPSTEELTEVDGTVLLCCQDTDDPTAEATGRHEIVGFRHCYQGKRYSNIATNGDLETGTTTGWTNNGCGTFEISNNSHSGSYSLHCVSDSNGDGVSFPVTLNTTLRYKISAYMKCVGPAGTSAKAKMKVGSAFGDSTNYESQTVGYDSYKSFDRWDYVEWIGKATSATTVISFVESSANAANDWYVDDLRVELWYPEETENILANPNFLTGATGWSFSSTPSGEYTISSNRLNVADTSRTSDAFATQQIYNSAMAEGRYRFTIDYTLTAGAFDAGVGNQRIWGIGNSVASSSVTHEVTGDTNNSNFRIVANQHCAGYFTSVTLYRVAEPKRNNPVPPLGIDEGVVFDGDTKINSQSYMYFPTGDTTQRGRGRGLAGGGWSPGILNQIYSVEIASDGVTNDFGNLTLARRGTAAVSSSTRAVWAGGYAPGYQDRIDYVTIATSANAIDFGNLDHGRFESSGVSNGTRGVFGPCENPAVSQNVIQYITIATTGNATDFGDSSISTGTKKQASMNSTTRGLFVGGQNVPSPSAYYDVIQYITIASTGNAQDFGDLTQTVFMCSGVSSSTRGVRAGGQVDPSQTNTDTIDFVTIASTGDATDFGNLSTSNQRSSAMSNSIRGLFSGGGAPNSSTQINTVDKINIASTGNATDWGDYFGTKVTQAAGCSDSHGGLS